MSTKNNPVFQALLNQPAQYLGRSARWVWTLQARERSRLSQEMRAMSGLMPLLMKQRNGYRWSREDKRKIKEQLRHLAAISPYLTLAVMPGGFFILPVLAWWLDRRRQKRIELGNE